MVGSVIGGRKAAWVAALATMLGLTLVALPASASADTYFVTESGDDANDCSSVAQACATVQRAIDMHRSNPQPDDVIDVGPGTFNGNIAADDPDDDGLTIRGAFNGQTRQTTLSGEDDGALGSFTAFLLGGCGAADVRLRNANLDTEGADPNVAAVELDGGSSLVNVHATNQLGTTAFEVVFACERGSAIERSEIVATDDANAIAVLDSLTLADSTVTAETNVSPAIVQFSGCCPGVRLRIRRSEVSAPPSTTPGDAPVVYSSARLTVDSSLITGGLWGVQTAEFPDWRINNSTIDAGEPGVSDEGTPSLVVMDPFDAADVNVESSLLVDPILATDLDDVGGTVSCDFSDLPGVQLDPTFTNDCQIGGGSTNTTTPPEELFVGGNPYDWRLLPDAPAIDNGAPGPPPAGMTVKDLAGNPRRAAGSTATCPNGTRDKGAYEFIGPPCELQPPQIIGGASPAPDTKLSSTRGDFNNKPTGYARLWLRCDAGGDNCTEIEPPRTRKGYTVRGSDVGHTLRLQVIATNAAGDSEPAVSVPTDVVAP